MSNELIPYKNMNIGSLARANLPEDQLIGIALDMLRYCNHTVKATSESINASLAKCDAIEKIVELYRKSQSEK